MSIGSIKLDSNHGKKHFSISPTIKISDELPNIRKLSDIKYKADKKSMISPNPNVNKGSVFSFGPG